jgi:hypothetical protein
MSLKHISDKINSLPIIFIIIIFNLLTNLEVLVVLILLLFGFDGCLAKTLFTSLGIFVCTLTSYVPLGLWGLDFIPTIIWASVITNGASTTVTID